MAKLSDRTGKNNPGWKGGIAKLRIRLRHCEKNVQWIKDCMACDGYQCQISGRTDNLIVHHKKELHDIVQELLEFYPGLDPIDDIDELFELAQNFDPFWDLSNGMTLADDVHKDLHKNDIDPELAKNVIRMHGEGSNRNEIAAALEKTWHVIDRIFDTLNLK